MIDAFHAAVEHAVEAFDRVRVNHTAAIPALPVADEIMAGKMLREVGILAGLVRHDAGARRHIRLDYRQEVLGGRAVNVEGMGALAALHQRQNRMLVSVAARVRQLRALSPM